MNYKKTKKIGGIGWGLQEGYKLPNLTGELIWSSCLLAIISATNCNLMSPPYIKAAGGSSCTYILKAFPNSQLQSTNNKS